MRTIRRTLQALTLTLASLAHAQPANPMAGAIPQARLDQTWWKARHESILAALPQHGDAQLLLLGDSILNNYDKSNPPDEDFQPTFQQFYAPRHALNLGFSGDTTSNLLWRLQHGEVQGLHPAAVLLLIGTNNTGFANQTAAQTQVGIDAVIADLERRLPQTKILLLGLLPSAVSPAKSAKDAAVNAYLANTYQQNDRVRYLDIGSIFFHNGTLNQAIFYDPRLPGHPGALHPDTVGQRRMAEAIEPTLAALLQAAPAVPLTSMTDVNTALIPVPWLEPDTYDWFARHHAALAAAPRIHPQVVLVGDSITHYWAGEPLGTQQRGPLAWQSVFGTTPTLNLGFGWDRIQNVLWRLRAGEFDGLHPKTIVVNIGTNNLTGTEHARASTPAEIVAGIQQVCDELRHRSPSSRIILMGIFPRNEQPENPLRAPIREVNAQLARLYATDSTVRFLDIGASFLQPDGTLRMDLMPDGTHPNEAGYQIWAAALRPLLQP